MIQKKLFTLCVLMAFGLSIAVDQVQACGQTVKASTGKAIRQSSQKRAAKCFTAEEYSSLRFPECSPKTPKRGKAAKSGLPPLCKGEQERLDAINRPIIEELQRRMREQDEQYQKDLEKLRRLKLEP